MSTPKKRGRGQPRKEPTQLVRAYAADVPRLKKHGKTQAQAIRNLLRATSLPLPAALAAPKTAPPPP